MQKESLKISFCTICMNRLKHMVQTLPQNLQDNRDYTNLEFIVLDYNSGDGMENWIKDNMGAWMDAGRVHYFKTTEPSVYHQSHSRNIAFRLASGDIVCNINADQYTGPSFASYINECFQQDPFIVLTNIDYFKTKWDHSVASDILGVLCMRKHDFLKVRGFDETMNNYGFEDIDIVNRIEKTGVRRMIIDRHSQLKFIEHGHEERYSIPLLLEKVDSIYVRYIGPAWSEMIFLYKDHHYEKGKLQDKFADKSSHYVNAYTSQLHRYQFYLLDAARERGAWHITASKRIQFQPLNAYPFELQYSDCQDLSDPSNSAFYYYRVTDPVIAGKIVEFKYKFESRIIMEKNLDEVNIIVNPGGFGKASVFNPLTTPSLAITI